MERFKRFLLALAVLCGAAVLIAGYIVGIALIPGAWALVFAFAPFVLALAWGLSSEDDGCW